jgi:hypothetical protein
LAFFPELRFLWTFSGFDSAASADQIALESCGLKFNTACVLLATDNTVTNAALLNAPRTIMPRLAYRGPYRPEMVPLFSNVQQLARDYAAMRGPKAMAIRADAPAPKITAETGATLAEAQAKALAKCTNPDSAYPCFVYAINDNVILPQRRTEPVP